MASFSLGGNGDTPLPGNSFNTSLFYGLDVSFCRGVNHCDRFPQGVWYNLEVSRGHSQVTFL